MKKEFMPPSKLVREWEAEYWQAGIENGRFSCSLQSFLLCKAAEWGSLGLLPRKKAANGRPDPPSLPGRQQLRLPL
jgi:hypothetical protein